MAETQGMIGYGTTFKIGNGASPNVFTSVLEVKSVNGFGFTGNEVNATHMESPNGYEEFVGGLKTGDTLTVRGNGSRDALIRTKVIWDAGTRVACELNLPSTLPDYDFSLQPLAWHLGDVTPGGLVEYEIAGRITGAITSSN